MPKNKRAKLNSLKIVVLISYLFAEVFTFMGIDKNSHSASDTLRPFILISIIFTGILIFSLKKVNANFYK